MRALNWQLAAARTPPEVLALGHRFARARQVAATDQQIDRLVHDLDALTADEIKIVAGVGCESTPPQRKE